MAHSEREISNFAGMCLTKELTKEILRGSLKLIGLIPLLNKVHCYLTKDFERGAPLAKPRPTGLAHSKREISNFDGTSLTKELTEAILRGP